MCYFDENYKQVDVIVLNISEFHHFWFFTFHKVVNSYISVEIFWILQVDNREDAIRSDFILQCLDALINSAKSVDYTLQHQVVHNINSHYVPLSLTTKQYCFELLLECTELFLFSSRRSAGKLFHTRGSEIQCVSALVSFWFLWPGYRASSRAELSVAVLAKSNLFRETIVEFCC